MARGVMKKETAKAKWRELKERLHKGAITFEEYAGQKRRLKRYILFKE